VVAEQVVGEYFTQWNEKNITELEKRVTPNKKGVPWNFDKLELHLPYQTHVLG